MGELYQMPVSCKRAELKGNLMSCIEDIYIKVLEALHCVQIDKLAKWIHSMTAHEEIRTTLLVREIASVAALLRNDI
jgi:hypothetical protein